MRAFASAQFDITVSDANELKATGITFQKSIRDLASGTVNTIAAGGQANGNKMIYQAGFFSTGNQYAGDLTVCKITFDYTGNTTQTVTLDNLELWRFTDETIDGVPELEKSTEPWSKTITVSRDEVTPTVAKPTASPAAGTYTSARNVTLSCSTVGASIYYTKNGTAPTTGSTLYEGAITVSDTTTIKAIAVKEGCEDSAVATFAYTIQAGGVGGGGIPTVIKVSMPTASPLPGTYASAQHVVLSCPTADAKIHYTTDNSAPMSSDTLYTGPITVDKTMTIKAIAVKEDCEDSAAASFAYTIQAAEITFPDVGSNFAWAKSAISALAARGVILGDSSGNFRPAAQVTRADFVVMLTRLVPLGISHDNMSFVDVLSGKYYTDAILNAAAAGLVNGTGNGGFTPQGSIKRQDAFVIIYRLLNRLGKTDQTGADLSTFTDASGVASYAKQAMAFLVGKGIVQGNGGLLNPTGNITRAETAVILYRIVTMFGV